MFDKLTHLSRRVICTLDCGAPVADLIMRIWVGNVFWKSGLTKIQSWDSTVYLFENIYKVPILSPALAATVGTAAELVLPVLLIFGIAGRAAAGALFVFNIMAVVSHPDMSPAGIVQHQVWGVILLALTLRGPGTLSIDHFIRKRFM